MPPNPNKPKIGYFKGDNPNQNSQDTFKTKKSAIFKVEMPTKNSQIWLFLNLQIGYSNGKNANQTQINQKSAIFKAEILTKIAKFGYL